MVLKYNYEIEKEDIIKEIDKLTDLIFKLLPGREEGGNWQTPLKNIILELVGMNRLLNGQINLFPLLCKLESLLTLTEEDDFLSFRSTIFECLNKLNKIKDNLQNELG